MKNTIKINRKQALMVAHRGVSGLEKENTTLAFVAAGNRSYWGIETDIHKTSDGKFIVFHDDTTERVAGVNYTVEETDFETLRAIPLLDMNDQAGRIDLRMPSLLEYLRICKDYGKISVLELKNAFEEADVQEIIRIIESEDYLADTVLISFDMQNLIYAKKFRPGIKAQFLLGKHHPENLFDLVREYGFDLDVYHKVVTEEFVNAVHAAGAKLNVWTVNDPEIAEVLISYGVDYITTNILE